MSEIEEIRRQTKRHRELENPFKPYSVEAATAVNDFVGIEYAGTLKAENKPPRVFLDNLWKAVLPDIEAHPVDKELYIGWDFIDGRLKITEIQEGKQKYEVDQDNEDVGLITVGKVTHAPHLFNFHTHVLDPSITLPDDRHLRKTIMMPSSSFYDLDGLVLNSKEYGVVIIDISQREGKVIGPSLVALKTTSTRVIENEDDYKFYRSFLTQKMLHEERYRAFLGPTLDPSLRINEMLESDRKWEELIGLAIYRGIIAEYRKSRQTALRLDLFYKRLEIARKILRKRKWWYFFK